MVVPQLPSGMIGTYLKFGYHARPTLGLGVASFATPRLRPGSDGAFQADTSLASRRVEMMAALLHPLSCGELKLASTDPEVQPTLDYNYLADPFDRDRLREAVRMCLTLAEDVHLKDFMGERLDLTDGDLATNEDLDQWLLREATTFSHISGTCKMGPSSDPMAVVDQYGRVRGIEGLRVVDASIMPDLVRAPINPAVIMIGERIADLIQQGQ